MSSNRNHVRELFEVLERERTRPHEKGTIPFRLRQVADLIDDAPKSTKTGLERLAVLERAVQRLGAIHRELVELSAAARERELTR